MLPGTCGPIIDPSTALFLGSDQGGCFHTIRVCYPASFGEDLNYPRFLHPLKSLAGFQEEHVPDVFVPARHPAVLFKGARWRDA